jgi:hypothetical protein
VQGESSWTWNIGLVYEMQGAIERAIEYCSIAVTIDEKLGHVNASRCRVH